MDIIGYYDFSKEDMLFQIPDEELSEEELMEEYEEECEMEMEPSNAKCLIVRLFELVDYEIEDYQCDILDHFNITKEDFISSELYSFFDSKHSHVVAALIKKYKFTKEDYYSSNGKLLQHFSNCLSLVDFSTIYSPEMDLASEITTQKASYLYNILHRQFITPEKMTPIEALANLISKHGFNREILFTKYNRPENGNFPLYVVFAREQCRRKFEFSKDLLDTIYSELKITDEDVVVYPSIVASFFSQQDLDTIKYLIDQHSLSLETISANVLGKILQNAAGNTGKFLPALNLLKINKFSDFKHLYVKFEEDLRGAIWHMETSDLIELFSDNAGFSESKESVDPFYLAMAQHDFEYKTVDVIQLFKKLFTVPFSEEDFLKFSKKDYLYRFALNTDLSTSIKVIQVLWKKIPKPLQVAELLRKVDPARKIEPDGIRDKRTSVTLLEAMLGDSDKVAMISAFTELGLTSEDLTSTPGYNVVFSVCRKRRVKRIPRHPMRRRRRPVGRVQTYISDNDANRIAESVMNELSGKKKKWFSLFK